MTATTEAKLRSLGASVESEPFPLKPLGRTVRRRIIVRRVSAAAAMATLLVGLVAGVVVASNLTGDRDGTVGPSARLQTHVDERFGWVLSYPSNWRLKEIKCPNDEDCELGVVVSNLEVGIRDYAGVFLTDVPKDFVGIGFTYEHRSRRLIGSEDVPDTEFPLTLKSLHLAYEWPRARYKGSVFLGGEGGFDVDLWIGPEASVEDVRAIEAVLASITKPLHVEPSPLGVGEVSTTVDGEEVGVRMEIEPALVPRGINPEFHLENTGAVDLDYGVDFKLEMETPSGGWAYLNEGQVWPLIGLGLAPGESDDDGRIAMADVTGQVELKPGTYRVTKEFDLVGRDEHVTVSALFVVTRFQSSPGDDQADLEIERAASKFGWGRVPLGDARLCPSGVTEPGETGDLRAFADDLMDAANGPDSDASRVWASMDPVLQGAFGSFGRFASRFSDRGLGKGGEYGDWEIAPTVVPGPHSGLVADLGVNCDEAVIEATTMLSAYYPSVDGVSGAVTQLFVVSTPSGPKLWFSY